MATIANQYDPNKPKSSEDDSTAQPVSVSGSEAQDDNGGAPSASNAAPVANASPKPTSSGRFQNLNAYLKANQNFNKDAGGLAGKVNQNLTSKSNDLQKNFAQSQQDYQTSLNNARQRYDQQFVNNTLGTPTSNINNGSSGINQNPNPSGSGNMGQTPGTFMTPEVGAPQQNQLTPPSTGNMGQTPENTGNMPSTVPAVLQSASSMPSSAQSDIDRFQQMLNASYKGPTSLDPNLNVQASNFANLAGQTGSEQGRFNLLKDLYNKPTYSSGQQTLDNLLLQSNPQQLNTLQANRTKANQINNNLRQAQVQAGVQASDATNEANATREATRNALTGAVSSFGANEDRAVKDALAARQKQFDTEQTGLTTGQLSSQDALNFGLINKLGDTQGNNPLYNLDLGKYLTQSNVSPTGQTVATPEDYQRIAALQKLSGGYATDDTSKIYDTYSDPTKAGTFAKENPYDFNQASYKTDWNNADLAYHGKADPLQQGIDTRKHANEDLIKYINSHSPFDISDNVYRSLANNQQGIKSGQASLDQLMQAMGANKKLGLTDASKFAPQTTTPDVSRQTALNNIYNRE